ncbi:MAG: transglutaminase family protein [Pseudomonadota bacterium]
MKIAIEHSTAWHCNESAGVSTQLLRLTPRDSARQHVVSWDLALPCHATRGTDPFGNVQHVLTLDAQKPAAGQRDITLTARGVVEIRPNAEETDDGLNPLLFLRTTTLTASDAAITDFADNFRVANPSRDVLRALMIAVGGQVGLDSTGRTSFSGGTAAEAMARRSGSCHDQAHLFLACARQLGVPARYVSGYVHGIEANRVSSHAWTEAFVHGHWHTFDIANRLDRPTTHLKLAIGMDYLDACPVRGVRFGGAREKLSAQTLIEQAQQANQ